MDFSYPQEAEAFREEFRAWLEEHLTDEFRNLEGFAEPGSDQLEKMREWNRLLAEAGYAAIAWPEEYGGRGASLFEQIVWAEEMHRAEAPSTLNPIGISNIAPAIMQYGNDEQKRHYLPRMLRGDDIWCQGFSEPDAGSDLAGLKTSAVRVTAPAGAGAPAQPPSEPKVPMGTPDVVGADEMSAGKTTGGEFVVNGQKVWNTFGNIATHCELLVRTDPDAPKHKGISCLLVDMDSPGVETRPLVTITGGEEFSELFFTDVRVPADNLLGPENDGWRVAITTLTHERAGVANLHLSVRKKIADLIDEARRVEIDGRPAIQDPVLRQRLARAYLEGEFLKLLAWRAVSGMTHGREAGPESSVAKLLWSDLHQEIGQIAGEVLGPAANAGDWGRDRVYTRAMSIMGGTTQVNKNIVAQRILGLPRR